MQSNSTYILIDSETVDSKWRSQSRRPVRPRDDEYLSHIVEACAANIVALDDNGSVVCVSRPWRVFTASNTLQLPNGSHGLELLTSCPPEGSENDQPATRFLDDVQQMIRTQRFEFHNHYIFDGVNGFRWFVVRATRLDKRGFAGARILVTLEDITLRRHAEEELRSICGRLINAQEEERKRIARDLHDVVSQRVAVLSIELEQLRRKLPDQQSDLHSIVRMALNQTTELASDIHQLSYHLHSFKLDQLGLSASLRSLCESFSTSPSLNISYREEGSLDQPSPDTALCVFRIAQESLHNVVKQSGAREAKVILTATPESVRLRIRDNGCGFDIEQARQKKRLGLTSMKERLRLVGGEMSIRSRRAQGTEIDILVPLQSTQHE